MRIPKSPPEKVEVKFHYSKDDTECSGDYHCAEIYFDDEEVFGLTDSYHDKAEYQFDGFFHACQYIYGNTMPETITTHINDSEY